jgi:hypothetical protein
MPASMSVNLRLPNGRFPSGSFNATLRAAAPWIRQDIQRAFGNAIDPVTGISWEPTKQRNRPLQRTLRLKNAAIAAVNTATINGNTLYLQVDDPNYGKYHITGTRRMPRRNFLGASKATLKKIEAKAGKDAIRATTRSRG